MESTKVIYYSDELNDEFSKGGITAKPIDGSYKYEGTIFRPLARCIVYHFIAKLFGFVFLKAVYGHKVVGKEKLKKAKGYFLYGNHTNAMADPFIPTLIKPFSDTYVLVHPDNVSMPVLGNITPCLGAIPLPDGKDAYKNFMNYVEKLNQKGKGIMIYPEAHIWPFYTHIRPFRHESFHYPVKFNAPVYCFTNTYQERKNRKRPRIVTYIDGPFYVNEELKRQERIVDLRNRVYDAMCEEAKHSNIEVIKYIKKEGGPSDGQY